MSSVKPCASIETLESAIRSRTPKGIQYIEQLIKSGENLNTFRRLRDQECGSPLSYAMRWQNVPAVKLLLEAKVNVDAREDGSSLVESINCTASEDAFLMTEMLLDHCPQLARRWGGGMALIHLCIHRVHGPKVMQRLIELKADPNFTTSAGDECPLGFAAVVANASAVRLLLAAGACPNLSLSDGTTPLITAVQFLVNTPAQISVVGPKLLLEHGAYLHRTAPVGYSALECAQSKQYASKSDLLAVFDAVRRRERQWRRVAVLTMSLRATAHTKLKYSILPLVGSIFKLL